MGTISVTELSLTPETARLTWANGGAEDAVINIADLIAALKTGPLKTAFQQAAQSGTVGKLNELLEHGLISLSAVPGAGQATYVVLLDFDTPNLVLKITTSAAQTGQLFLRYNATQTR